MTFDSAKDLLPKPNAFYCGICFETFETDLSSTTGLDSHLRREHNIPVGIENGKATLERDSIQAKQKL